MFTVINKQILGKSIVRLKVSAESIARTILPGQFIMVCVGKNGQWLPMPVAEAEEQRGLITIIFKEIGEATQRLGAMRIGENITSIMGPLGKPASVNKKFGTVICVAEGMGIVAILPICRALKKSGNKVIGIIGAKTRRELAVEPQMRITCNKIFVRTDEGSYGRKSGFLDRFREVFVNNKPQLVYAIGPVDMMKELCRFTEEMKVATLVHLNLSISCGIGRCGSCRTKVGNKVQPSCQEGPEFDGHKVDFEQLKMRAHASSASSQIENKEMDSSQDEGGILKKIFSGIS